MDPMMPSSYRRNSHFSDTFWCRDHFWAAKHYKKSTQWIWYWSRPFQLFRLSHKTASGHYL